jgi:hypothetical protein
MATSHPGFSRIINRLAYDIVYDEYVAMNTPTFQPPTDEIKQRARAFADHLRDEGKLGEYLEATAPKPCECCGRI